VSPLISPIRLRHDCNRGTVMNVRVTILGLMGVIALIGVGMAAIRRNDEIAAAVFSR
jgi:hypothetical protein